MNTLATLYRLREYLGFASTDTTEDSRLLMALEAATTLIERHAGRRFSPRCATLLHDLPHDPPGELLLTEDLLTLTQVTNGDGSIIPLADIQVLPGGRLVLRHGAAFVDAGSPIQAIAVEGVWGWHPDWTQAWRLSGDSVQNASFSSSANTLTVSDADGPDSAAQSPRFQVGQLLRLTSEYVRVLAVDATANLLTLARGAQGSPAAVHAQHTPIEVYQPPRDAELLCLRLAAWFYREPNTVNGPAIPPMLRPMLETLRRPRVS